MRRLIPIVTSLLVSLSVVLAPATAQVAQPTFYLETFTLDTAQPTPYRPAGFDVTVVSHPDDTIGPMWAEHGPNCEAPDPQWAIGTMPRPESNHHITQAQDSVFSCRDHIMTAMNAGYGSVYLTPPAMLDWSNGPATLEWVCIPYTSSN